jgi:hypothetical protein
VTPKGGWEQERTRADASSGWCVVVGQPHDFPDFVFTIRRRMAGALSSIASGGRNTHPPISSNVAGHHARCCRIHAHQSLSRYTVSSCGASAGHCSNPAGRQQPLALTPPATAVSLARPARSPPGAAAAQLPPLSQQAPAPLPGRPGAAAAPRHARAPAPAASVPAGRFHPQYFLTRTGVT